MAEITDEHLHKVFEAIDENKDGYVDWKELVNVMLKLLGVTIKKDAAVSFIEKYDKDGNGVLDVKEFIALIRRMLELRDKFNEFDLDGDGFITLDEVLKANRANKNRDLTPEEVLKLGESFRRTDKNGDGKVEYVELLFELL